jgi:outer membrane protein OmpA-like peptidoglycan-associated protein
MTRTLIKCLTILISALFVTEASAQVESADEVNAIIKSLAPIVGQSVSGGALVAGPPVLPEAFLPPIAQGRPVQIIIDHRPIVLDYRSSLDLTIYFAYDSAFLTPQARYQLSLLGEALLSPFLAEFRYLLAGHSDARGPDDYNMDLSYRRAWAVKRYLMRNFGIASWRLEVVGWGELYLRTPMQPYDAINRRVEITLISGEVPALQPSDAETQTMSGGGAPSLPPCPATVVGSLTNPDLDLDDFAPEPFVDCDPSLPMRGTVIVQPDGRMIVQP